MWSLQVSMQYLRKLFHMKKIVSSSAHFFSYRRVAFEKGSQFFSATIIYSSNGCQRQCRSVFSDFPSLLLSPQPATVFFLSDVEVALKIRTTEQNPKGIKFWRLSGWDVHVSVWILKMQRGFFFLTPNSNLKIYSCIRLSILANRSFDA